MFTTRTVLFVDGACRGNPGVGGWGVFIEHNNSQQEQLFGGEQHTTNNRMELTAAIEGIKHLPPSLPLLVWTDSSYVQKGISEWIIGWKRKQWRKSDGSPVINADLWQQLDKLCDGRDIDWRWIKGHAGHYGNEMADQLANKGADSIVNVAGRNNVAADTTNTDFKKNNTDDWLSNDPLGFDSLPLDDAEEDDDTAADIAAEIDQEINTLTEGSPQSILHENTLDNSFSNNNLQDNAIPPATFNDTTKQGKRYLILDTETTGFDPSQGDRLVEFGAFEMIDRKLTGKSLHLYFNPKRDVGDSENIHGLSNDFLKDKPLFSHVADQIIAFISAAGIIAHNAQFDMRFLHAELNNIGKADVLQGIEVIDTLAIAKQKHPNQKNSLDALVKRYHITARDRTFHGALLDAEILTDVYLAMTGGQVTLAIDDAATTALNTKHQTIAFNVNTQPLVIAASATDVDNHCAWIMQHGCKDKKPTAFWHQLSTI